jgi:predicted metal-dependent phosphoesterase TrpH
MRVATPHASVAPRASLAPSDIARVPAAADLHVHSRFSSRPPEWLLERVGAPESFSDPLVVYRRARERGMTFVTLTDHDTIDGALEIAHLPGVFLSSEVTVRFPEDGCLFHCLVFDVDEGRHREIQRLRENVYELRDYLYDEGIAHAVAHPLFAVNDRLRLEHVEKLLVLFKGFEGLNGAHHARSGAVARSILNNVTPRLIEELANRHDIDPRDPQAWRKHLIAGSDDHSGLYVASAWTASAGADTLQQFLAELRRGELEIRGVAGSGLALGRSLHRLAGQWARTRVAQTRGASAGPSPSRHGAEPHRLNTGPAAPSDEGATLADRSLALYAALADHLVRGEAPDVAGLSSFLSAEAEDGATATGSLSLVIDVAGREWAAVGRAQSAEHASYHLATRFGERLAFTAVQRGLRALARGDAGSAIDAAQALVPATLCLAPYLIAFRALHKDESLLRSATERFAAGRLLRERSGRTAWLADGRSSTTSLAMADVVRGLAGADDRIELLHCGETAAADLRSAGVGTRAFEPLGALGGLDRGEAFVLPPVMELLEHCEQRQFDRVVFEAPGPMACVGSLLGSLLGIEQVVVWRPELVDRLLRSRILPEPLLWTLLRWLHGEADRVLVPDPRARAILAARGFRAERIVLVDLETGAGAADVAQSCADIAHSSAAM